MKHRIVCLVMLGLLAGCATYPDDHEGLRETQEMTDMDGRPIAPAGGVSVGAGIGIGGWGPRGGFGIGIGTGW